MAATKRVAMDCSVSRAKRMIAPDGGTSAPKVPPAATVPLAKEGA